MQATRPQSPRASRLVRKRITIRVTNAIRPVEARYVRALVGVMKAVHREYQKRVAPYLEAIATHDAKLSPRQARTLNEIIQASDNPTNTTTLHHRGTLASLEEQGLIEKSGEAFGRPVYTPTGAGRAAASPAIEIAMRPVAGDLQSLELEVHAAIARTVGPLFDRFAKDVTKASAKGQALMGIKPNDTGIPGLLARARDANIALVENAHRFYAQQVRDIVGNPDNFGLRVEDLKDKILERSDVSESRAELIARDQTLKLNGQIAATRQQAAGVDSYVWSTSLDDRVRDEHAALEGQTFAWTSPPEPGHPGEDFQCRCIAIPVGIQELDDVFGE